MRAYGWAAALAAVVVWAFVGAFTRALPWPLSVLFGWSAAVAFVACGYEVKLARARNRREAERAPIPDGIATANGIVLTHPVELCEPPCPVHAPSGHHMNDWPLNWRDDRRLWERTCAHGVGHPDPDDIAYKKRHWRNPDDAAAQTIHACCGCCSATAGSAS